MAKTSQRVRQARPAKYKTREYTRCRRCGRAARRVPQVRPLPDLPARARPRRVHPRHDEVELVDQPMSMTDPIADFLTRIRNGIRAAHEIVEIPSSQAQARARADPQASRATSRTSSSSAPDARPSRRAASAIRLKYTDDRQPVITGLRRVSRPGRRPYVGRQRIPKVQGGMGTAIMSTSHGVMTGHEARRAASAARSWRRSGERSRMSPHRHASPSPSPPASTVAIEPELVRVNGPKGELSERIHRDIDVERERGAQRHAARPTAASTAPCTASRARSSRTWSRASPTATRSGSRSRASATAPQLQGQRTSSCARLLAPGADQGAARASSSRSRSRRASIVRGISKQLVGETAANIRKQRPPEPYKGKGIRYEGEYVARKVGKRA